MAKLLIAEDDPFLIKAYKAKLSKTQIEFQLAQDGEEVLKILSTFTPDLILLDLIMPKKDGFEVLKELKAADRWKNIPVIVTSNLSQADDKEKVKALGAVDYLVKSDVGIEEIVQKIESHLKV